MVPRSTLSYYLFIVYRMYYTVCFRYRVCTCTVLFDSDRCRGVEGKRCSIHPTYLKATERGTLMTRH